MSAAAVGAFSKVQQKVLSKVTVVGDGHWLPKGSETVWVPEIGRVVTVRRAAYAAFRSPVPEDHEARAACGMRQCVAPHHAELAESKSRCAGVDLSGCCNPPTHPIDRAPARVPEKAREKPVKVDSEKVVSIDSRGIPERAVAGEGREFDPKVVARVREMADSPLSAVCQATGLTHVQVVRVRGRLLA